MAITTPVSGQDPRQTEMEKQNNLLGAFQTSLQDNKSSSLMSPNKTKKDDNLLEPFLYRKTSEPVSSIQQSINVNPSIQQPQQASSSGELYPFKRQFEEYQAKMNAPRPQTQNNPQLSTAETILQAEQLSKQQNKTTEDILRETGRQDLINSLASQQRSVDDVTKQIKQRLMERNDPATATAQINNPTAEPTPTPGVRTEGINVKPTGTKEDRSEYTQLGSINDFTKALFGGKNGKITQEFKNYNPRLYPKGKYHTGTDFGIDGKAGHEIFNIFDDLQVVRVVDGHTQGGVGRFDVNGGYGNQVILQNPKTGEKFKFSHLQNGINLKVGDTLPKGQVIGKMGSTGNSTAPHLDLEYFDANGRLSDIGLAYSPTPILSQLQ